MSDNKKNGNTVIIIIFCLLFVCGVLGTIAFVMEMTKKKCATATPTTESFQIEKYNSGNMKLYVKNKACNNSGSSNYTWKNTATTLEECKTTCNNDPTCRHISYGNEECYIGTDDATKCTKVDDNGYSLYIKETKSLLNDNTTKDIIYELDGKYLLGTCSSKCELDSDNNMVCKNPAFDFKGEKTNNKCMSKNNKDVIRDHILKTSKICLKNGDSSESCQQSNNNNRRLLQQIYNTDRINNELAKNFDNVLNTSAGTGNRLRELFQDILEVKNKDSDLSNNKDFENNPKLLQNYHFYLNHAAKAYRAAIDDNKSSSHAKQVAKDVFNKLKKNGALNIVFTEKLINRFQQDLGKMLNIDFSTTTATYTGQENYQGRGGGSYICTAVKNTQKSVSDEDYEIISKFGKWAVQQPEYTKGLGLYFGAMRHLMPVISHMERDNDLFWGDLTDFFYECVDGVKSRDYDRVIHLFTVKSIHLAEKYFGGISHLKGVVPDDEYTVLQNVYDDRKKYVEKYVLAN